MKKILTPCLAAVFTVAMAHAAASDDVIAAAKKLSAAANYTWTSTTQSAGGGGGGGRGGFGNGTATGMTEKDGYTVITRETPNGAMQTVRKADAVVMQNPQGEWMTMEEMRAQFGQRGGGGGGGAAAGAGGNRGGGVGRGGPGGGMFGQANPADEITNLVTASKELKAADGVISGALTDEAVAQRLSFGGFGRGGGGQPPPAPTNASGTVKFWVADGQVTKYELHVKGTVNGRNGEMQIDRTTTVEFKDFGTTKVVVPDEAKKKLGA